MLCDGMPMSARRLLALVAVAALGDGAAQAVAATGGGGVGLGGDRAARHTTPPASTATTKARKKPPRGSSSRARAVKLSGGVGRVPPRMLTSRPPLTGTGAGGSGSGGGGGTATTPTTTTGSPGTTTPTTTDPPSQQAVGVTLDDRGAYSALLSRQTVAAGSVVMQLINQGEDEHNLRVVALDHAGAAVDFPLTAPGANSTKTLALTTGTYRVFCTLTTPVNHEAAGMQATLHVTASDS
jgi:plastocyanin